jgi:hypothetical protein
MALRRIEHHAQLQQVADAVRQATCGLIIHSLELCPTLLLFGHPKTSTTPILHTTQSHATSKLFGVILPFFPLTATKTHDLDDEPQQPHGITRIGDQRFL